MTRAQQIVQQLHEIGLSDAAIARIVCCRAHTIWRIRHGQESGRNIFPRLQRVVQLIQENYLAAHHS